MHSAQWAGKQERLTFAGDVREMCVRSEWSCIFCLRKIMETSIFRFLAMYAGLGAVLWATTFRFIMRFKGGQGNCRAGWAGCQYDGSAWLVPIPSCGVRFDRRLFDQIRVARAHWQLHLSLLSARDYCYIGQPGRIRHAGLRLIHVSCILSAALLLAVLAWYRHKANIGRLLSRYERTNSVSGKKIEAK